MIDWAAGREAVIIEDDYDAEFRYDRDPVGALQGLAPESVALIGTVSKSASGRDQSSIFPVSIRCMPSRIAANFSGE